MEQLLRQRFRAEVLLVAGWQPSAWQAATASVSMTAIVSSKAFSARRGRSITRL